MFTEQPRAPNLQAPANYSLLLRQSAILHRVGYRRDRARANVFWTGGRECKHKEDLPNTQMGGWFGLARCRLTSPGVRYIILHKGHDHIKYTPQPIRSGLG